MLCISQSHLNSQHWSCRCSVLQALGFASFLILYFLSRYVKTLEKSVQAANNRKAPVDPEAQRKVVPQAARPLGVDMFIVMTVVTDFIFRSDQ